MKFDNLTVDQMKDLMADKRDALLEVRDQSPEPEYIDRLITDLRQTFDALYIFHGEKKMKGIYSNGYPENLIDVCDYFIENPGDSIHVLKQEVLLMEDPYYLGHLSKRLKELKGG